MTKSESFDQRRHDGNDLEHAKFEGPIEDFTGTKSQKKSDNSRLTCGQILSTTMQDLQTLVIFNENECFIVNN